MGPYSEDTQYRRSCNLARVILDSNIDPEFRRIYQSKLNTLARSESDYMARVKGVYPEGINVHLRAIIE